MFVPRSTLLSFLLLHNVASAVSLDFASTTALDYSALEEADQVKPAKTGPKPTEPEVECECGEEAFVIDFSRFDQHEYVTELIKNGLTVKAIGSADGESHTPGPDGNHNPEGGAARVFDSSDPAPDFDLGSPNENCENAGPGRGEAGRPGMSGENCIPQGNLLIIQRRLKDRADDAEGGGSMVFTIDGSVKYRLRALGILDVPRDARVNVFTKNRFNNEDTLNYFVGLGPNAFQEVALDVPIRWHSEFRIELPADGGLSWLKFCQPERKPTPDGAVLERRMLRSES